MIELKSRKSMVSRRILLLCAAALLSLNLAVKATPYASAVTVNAGTVSFILNEAADNVTVVFDGGASTLNMGALPAGTHTFNLGTATSFEIVVQKDSPPGYSQGVTNQISSDANVLNRFVNQRGVTVNKNPNSAAFGRVYVSVATAGNNTASGRALQEGIYVLNADQTEVAGLGTNALLGGLTFTAGAAGAESPGRLHLAADNMLYISDWSDANGSLFVTDADVSGGQNVLPGVGGPFPITSSRVHGSIAASWTEGSLATGDLAIYVIDEDLQSNPDATAQTERNSIWRWDVGAGPFPAPGPPVRLANPLLGIASQRADLSRGPDGKWYASQRRAEPATTAGVFVLAPDGTPLWNSRQASRDFLNNQSANDLLGESVAIDVSPDGKWLAVLRRETNSISVLPMTEGIPDMTNRVILATTPTTGDARDLAFDAANNLYFVSSGSGLLRIYSPGGRTTAATRSDGTFTVTNIGVPFVSVAATDAQGAEEGSDPVTFTLTRNDVNLDQPLTVNYTLTGQAANGADYPMDPLSIAFPANVASATVTLAPTDDSVAELTETVVLTISVSIDYGILQPASATAMILDNEPPTLRLTTGSKTNIYEPLGADIARVTITRLGETNVVDILGVELVHTGAAIDGHDFSWAPLFIPMPPGVRTATVTYTPIDDDLLEGNEPIIVTLGFGSGEYQIDAQNSVTLVVRDDELPPAPVLFADDFNSIDSAAAWQEQFGANNGIRDAEVHFGYDYGAAGIPLAPKTRDGTSAGLFMTVNKADPTALGSAGINFYPIGQSFSGDYALRFDMYLSFGTTVTTEHALLGINHSGDKVNRATQSADPNNTTAGGDGFWVGIVTDASNLRDYSAYTYPTPESLPTVVTNRAASTLTSVITSPPYAIAGSPGSSGNSRSWSEVELSQVNNLITLKVNNIVIWQYDNATAPTSGNIMIGSNDQFDSVGTAQHFVIFDNLRVVSLETDPRITRVVLLPNNQIQIDFRSPTGGAAAAYRLQSKAALGAAMWDDDNGAQITSVGANEYQAVTTRVGAEHYYRISKP